MSYVGILVPAPVLEAGATIYGLPPPLSHSHERLSGWVGGCFSRNQDLYKSFYNLKLLGGGGRDENTSFSVL